MVKLQNKIIVITGAASGIGRALAFEAADRKMKLMLTDIEAIPLQETKQALEQQGVVVHTEIIDVTDPKALITLADITAEKLGVPDVLINNAGVSGPIGPIWELPLEKLKWNIGVNLFGVIHSLRAFLPSMIAKSDQRFIVNTASMAGFYTAPYLSAYEIAKHGVVALSEALHHDLKTRDSKIQVSVLAPGWVKTNILTAERNCPHPAEEPNYENYSDKDAQWLIRFAKSVKRGMEPSNVAKIVFESLLQNKFYIFTHPEMKENIQNRAAAIMDEAAPSELILD